MKAKVLVVGPLFLSLSLLCLQLEEKEKLSKIEQKIKAISDNECIAKYISTLKVEDDGSMYRIYLLIYPLFEPRSYDQIQTWTDAVCKSSKRILDNYGLVRDISVWAIRPIRFSWAEPVGAIVYGRTFYNRHTDKFEFKKGGGLRLQRRSHDSQA